MPKQHLPDRVKSWLNKRGISDETIRIYELAWNGTHIVIPVHDAFGKILFNKYRRDPDVTEGAKYLYDAGSKSSLYGLKTLTDARVVFIVEGEMDALALISKGVQAVSSTGGAGSWSDDFTALLSRRDCIIVYDYDDAGIKGAFNVASLVPGSRIAWLPKEVGEHGDVTDFFVKLGKSLDDFLILPSGRYPMPEEWNRGMTRKELTEVARRHVEEIEKLMLEAQKTRGAYRSDRHLQILIQTYMDRLTQVRGAIKSSGRKVAMDADRITRARAVPMTNFIEFNRQKYAPCIWHKDANPSMFYYEKMNKVHCFGCNANGDTIDVVRQQRGGCGIKEAIEHIIGYEQKG